ncbi:unnamed protein product [Caretta caretta]
MKASQNSHLNQSESRAADPSLAVMCCCVWNKSLFSLSVAVPQLPAWERAAAYYNHTQHDGTGQMRTQNPQRIWDNTFGPWRTGI